MVINTVKDRFGMCMCVLFIKLAGNTSDYLVLNHKPNQTARCHLLLMVFLVNTGGKQGSSHLALMRYSARPMLAGEPVMVT